LDDEKFQSPDSVSCGRLHGIWRVRNLDRCAMLRHGANVISTGGSVIFIGPSNTPCVWVKFKKTKDNYKEGQAIGELFLLDKRYPTYSMKKAKFTDYDIETADYDNRMADMIDYV
ncbi:1043_t:CDS:2, partial [Acaulospora morrowiae]